MEFNEIIQKGIEKANQEMKSDKKFQEVLNQYHGRRIIVNIPDDNIYAISISKEGISLDAPSEVHPEDMYLEIDQKIIEKLLNGQLNSLQMMSLFLTQKIKIKNIGIEDINLFKQIIGDKISNL